MHNLDLLTSQHSAVAAKKRARKAQIDEVLFDEDARMEYLTGFHKRKLAKTLAAKNKAIAREKQAQREARNEQRQALRQQALDNAIQVEAAYGAVLDVSSLDSEWSGVGADKSENKATDAYEDEDTVATVTVVEDLNPDEFIHGPPSATPHKPTAKQPTSTPSSSTPRPASKPRPKKIKYGTKGDRKKERSKQRGRQTEKAERAGGKAARVGRAKRGKQRR